MLPLIRFATISGIPLMKFITDVDANYLISKTKSIAAEVISLKGATVYAPGNAVSAMIESISNNSRAIMPVSVMLDGEYGYNNVCIGVPCILGSDGIEKIIELELNHEEGEVFKRGVENIRSAISEIQL
jgi:malate dehydrogenase